MIQWKLSSISLETKNDYYIVVVKKTFRYSNVFFYNHLCRNSVTRNIIMKSGIKDGRRKKLTAGINSRDFLKYSGAAGGALLLEAISKIGFLFKIAAGPSFKPQAYCCISRI